MTTIAEANGTVKLANTPQFIATLRAVAAKAREALPQANGRIERAVELAFR